MHSHLLRNPGCVLDADALKGAQHIVKPTEVSLDSVVSRVRADGRGMRLRILPQRLGAVLTREPVSYGNLRITHGCAPRLERA
eukprot:7380615-Prymnesium_polylepis.1